MCELGGAPPNHQCCYCWGINDAMPPQQLSSPVCYIGVHIYIFIIPVNILSLWQLWVDALRLTAMSREWAYEWVTLPHSTWNASVSTLSHHSFNQWNGMIIWTLKASSWMFRVWFLLFVSFFCMFLCACLTNYLPHPCLFRVEWAQHSHQLSDVQVLLNHLVWLNAVLYSTSISLHSLIAYLLLPWPTSLLLSLPPCGARINKCCMPASYRMCTALNFFAQILQCST